MRFQPRYLWGVVPLAALACYMATADAPSVSHFVRLGAWDDDAGTRINRAVLATGAIFGIGVRNGAGVLWRATLACLVVVLWFPLTVRNGVNPGIAYAFGRFWWVCMAGAGTTGIVWLATRPARDWTRARRVRVPLDVAFKGGVHGTGLRSERATQEGLKGDSPR